MEIIREIVYTKKRDIKADSKRRANISDVPVKCHNLRSRKRTKTKSKKDKLSSSGQFCSTRKSSQTRMQRKRTRSLVDSTKVKAVKFPFDLFKQEYVKRFTEDDFKFFNSVDVGNFSPLHAEWLSEQHIEWFSNHVVKDQVETFKKRKTLPIDAGKIKVQSVGFHLTSESTECEKEYYKEKLNWLLERRQAAQKAFDDGKLKKKLVPIKPTEFDMANVEDYKKASKSKKYKIVEKLLKNLNNISKLFE